MVICHFEWCYDCKSAASHRHSKTAATCGGSVFSSKDEESGAAIDNFCVTRCRQCGPARTLLSRRRRHRRREVTSSYRTSSTKPPSPQTRKLCGGYTCLRPGQQHPGPIGGFGEPLVEDTARAVASWCCGACAAQQTLLDHGAREQVASRAVYKVKGPLAVAT